MHREKTWYVKIQDYATGPFTEAEVIASLQNQVLTPQTSVYHPKLKTWKPIHTIPSLQKFFPAQANILSTLIIPEIPLKYQDNPQAIAPQKPDLEKRLKKVRQDLQSEAENLLLESIPTKAKITETKPSNIKLRQHSPSKKLFIITVIVLALACIFALWLAKKRESDYPIPQSPTTSPSEEKEQPSLKPPTRPNRTTN